MTTEQIIFHYSSQCNCYNVKYSNLYPNVPRTYSRKIQKYLQKIKEHLSGIKDPSEI